MIVLSLVLIVVAVVIGLAYNRLVWRPRQEAGDLSSDGLQMKEVTGPLASLAVLLVAFTLVQSFNSWSGAKRAEAGEAAATLNLFRQAELYGDARLRDEVRGDVVCYSTAVIEQEWPAMSEGRYSNVPAYWASQIRRTAIRQVRSGTDERAGVAVLDRDRERTIGRQDRLNEAGSDIPTAVFLLMLAAVFAAVLLIGVVTAKGVSPGVHVVVVIAAAIIFGSALLLIRSLDSPFTGFTARGPEQTIAIRSQMLNETSLDELPCDESGLPVDDALFRPRTFPLA